MNKLLCDVAADRARKSIIGLAISLACSSMSAGQTSQPDEKGVAPTSTLPVLTAVAIQPPGPEPITDVRVSPDGQRLAYVQRTNQMCRFVLHEGPTVDCDEISTWGFTRDNVCYAVVRRGFAWHLAVDGKVGAAFDSIDIKSWDSFKDTYPAFKAKRENLEGWLAFGNGKENFLQGVRTEGDWRIAKEQLSQDGQHFWQLAINAASEAHVYRNGALVEVLHDSSNVSFAPVGENFAYSHELGKPDGRTPLTEFVAGNLRKRYFWVNSIIWSQKGEHVIFMAGRPAQNEQGEETVIVYDGHEFVGQFLETYPRPVFAPNGARFAVRAARGRRRQGQDRGILSESQFIPTGNADIREIQFSPDGNRLTYVKVENAAHFFVVDDKQHGPYSATKLACFSPDGQHWAIAASMNGVWTVVVDGQRQCPLGEIREIEFSKDSQHVYYVATPSSASNQQALYRDANVMFPLVNSNAVRPFGLCDELIEFSSIGLGIGGTLAVSPLGVEPIKPEFVQLSRKHPPSGQPVLFGKSPNAPLKLFRLNLERVLAPRKLASGKVIENNEMVQTATISEDGSSVFAVLRANRQAKESGELVVMAAASGNVTHRLPLAEAQNFQLISAGTNVAVGLQDGLGGLRIDTWNAADLAAPPQTVLVNDIRNAYLAAVDPRKRLIAVGGWIAYPSNEMVVRVHDLASSKRTGTIHDATHAVFDPSSDSLLTVSPPTGAAGPKAVKLKLWDLERGVCTKICTLPPNCKVRDALFEPAEGSCANMGDC